MWHYYCENLALPDNPDFVMQCYHAKLVKIPWQQYVPDLSAMDLMMKVETLLNIVSIINLSN